MKYHRQYNKNAITWIYIFSLTFRKYLSQMLYKVSLIARQYALYQKIGTRGGLIHWNNYSLNNLVISYPSAKRLKTEIIREFRSFADWLYLKFWGQFRRWGDRPMKAVGGIKYSWSQNAPYLIKLHINKFLVWSKSYR